MHEHDTPYDEVEKLLAQAHEILARDDGFASFLAEHPELDDLDNVSPALEEIERQVAADMARRSFRVRMWIADGLVRALNRSLPRRGYRVRLADWLDARLLP
jgi:hypothetical protein